MRFVVLDSGLGEDLRRHLSGRLGSETTCVVGLEAAADLVRAHLAAGGYATLRLAYVVPTRDVAGVVRSSREQWAALVEDAYARSRLCVLWVIVPEGEDESANVWGVHPPDAVDTRRQAWCLVLERAGLIRSRGEPGALSPHDRIALVSNIIGLYHSMPDGVEHDPRWAWLWGGVFSVAAVRVALD